MASLKSLSFLPQNANLFFVDSHTQTNTQKLPTEYATLCVCCTMCASLFFTLDAGLLAKRQYSEGPAAGHLDTGFSWFPCV